jgi:hypothetical protein
MHRGGFCASRGYYEHALASLALGDTAAAEAGFALAFASYPPRLTAAIDTVRVHLGPRFDEGRYVAKADAAHRAAGACAAAARDRQKERSRRLGG